MEAEILAWSTSVQQKLEAMGAWGRTVATKVDAAWTRGKQGIEQRLDTASTAIKTEVAQLNQRIQDALSTPSGVTGGVSVSAGGHKHIPLIECKAVLALEVYSGDRMTYKKWKENLVAVLDTRGGG